MSKWVRMMKPVALLDPNTDKPTTLDQNGKEYTLGDQEFEQTVRSLNNSLLVSQSPDLPSIWSLRDRLRKAVKEKSKVLEIADNEYSAMSTAARSGAGLNPVGRYSLAEHLNEIINACGTPEEALAKNKLDEIIASEAAQTTSDDTAAKS